ncbi:hypothetical protein HNP84_007289 [Thermocatellispora tengchongensis]|uniref:Acyltransferase 3 domain-containing protein n=1 Tax=Thermocatellispora tengchongensis TaxID=1073253 RepID=A0A840PKE2_9ACTN|nr:acyltransferase family protein [Thermocatellispora tengchongensis]MBB5137537.1 hypothetical protein [Thermocatellispora tengchongensis]
MGVTILGLPSPAYLPQYAALFTVGLLAARRGRLGSLSRTAGRAGFAAAAVAAVALVLVLGAGGEAGLGRGTLPSLVAAACESALAVGIILGLLVLFRERFGHQGRRRRFLSAHAYAVYVIHPVVVVVLNYALRDVQAPAVAKAALLAILALPLCWATAYLVRALPGARKVLWLGAVAWCGQGEEDVVHDGDDVLPGHMSLVHRLEQDHARADRRDQGCDGRRVGFASFGGGSQAADEDLLVGGDDPFAGGGVELRRAAPVGQQGDEGLAARLVEDARQPFQQGEEVSAQGAGVGVRGVAEALDRIVQCLQQQLVGG